MTATRNVYGATLSSSQPGKERVTVAVPVPASSGTRTGSWKRFPQQCRVSGTRNVMGSIPGALAGK
jgi:hypothetical protein